MQIIHFIVLLVAALNACQSAPEQPAAPTGDMALPVEIRQMLDRYEQIGLTLAADSTNGVVDAAQGMIAAANKVVASTTSPVEKAAVMAVAPVAQNLMQSVQTQNIAVIREQFGQLSQAMVTLAQGYPSVQTEHMLVQCPMVTQGFNQWIQRQGKIRNPYKGREMVDCGSQEPWK